MNFFNRLKNLNWQSVILSGIAGTTAMTVFSYQVSAKERKYFKEPEILNDLLYGQEYVREEKKEKGRPLLPGFFAHYVTGLLFTTCYHLFWRKKDVPKRAIVNGLTFGGAFGLQGIGIWKTVFTLHPNPPSGIDLRRYIGHLLLAHLVFGETVALTATLAEKSVGSKQ